MDINFKQSQFELFPHSHQDTVEPHKPKFFLSRVTLNFENLIILTICFFIVMILSFSLGMERGKRTATDIIADSETVSNLGMQMPAKEDTEPKEIVYPATAVMLAHAAEKTISTDQEVIGLSGENHFTVQVASFKTKKFAEMEADSLRQRGYDSFILPKGSHIIVCVGRFSNRNEAVAFSDQLKNQYKDCFARRL